jgi:hypothetical protein
MITFKLVKKIKHHTESELNTRNETRIIFQHLNHLIQYNYII